jgi:hypothetical protein
MADTVIKPPVKATPSDGKITYTRFSLPQRVEHIVFLLSFTILGFTGLIQKFSANPVSDSFLVSVGSKMRLIHHFSAIIMMIVSGYHVLTLIYKICPAGSLDDDACYRRYDASSTTYCIGYHSETLAYAAAITMPKNGIPVCGLGYGHHGSYRS